MNRLLEVEGKNQVDLAAKMDVSSATASDWCTGKKIPRMDMIERIAKWFGVSVSSMFSEVNEEKQDTAPYYYNKETRQIADEISKDPELRLLFDAARDVRPEDMQALQHLLKSLKRKENHEDDA